jgi:hypothetical protein
MGNDPTSSPVNVVCSSGYSMNSNGAACTQCSAGYYSTGGPACSQCPSGKYSSAGAGSCTDAPGGRNQICYLLLLFNIYFKSQAITFQMVVAVVVVATNVQPDNSLLPVQLLVQIVPLGNTPVQFQIDVRLVLLVHINPQLRNPLASVLLQVPRIQFIVSSKLMCIYLKKNRSLCQWNSYDLLFHLCCNDLFHWRS